MTTLTETTARQSAILMAINQVESILAPIHTGQGKNDQINILPFNLERLARHSDILSNDFISIRVVKEPAPEPKAENYHVEIAGDKFGYIFSANNICSVKKQLEKSFKAVESFTKKAAKGQPARPTESPAPARAINQVPETLTIDSKLLKKDSETVNNDSEIIPNCTEDDYICSVISPIRETRPWYYSTSKSSNPTPTTLDEFLSETWKSFATI